VLAASLRTIDGGIDRFATFMTGECYALLRQHSILARMMMPPDEGDLDAAAFAQGVHHARRSGTLLHAAFSARTLALFERLAPAALPSYLSGLVIGEELRAQDLRGTLSVVVIGAQALTRRYELALATLGVTVTRVASEATWRGLHAIASTLQENT